MQSSRASVWEGVRYSDSYCETEVGQVWLCRSFLDPTSEVAKEHLDLVRHSG